MFFKEWQCPFVEALDVQEALDLLLAAVTVGEPFDTVIVDLYRACMAAEKLGEKIKLDPQMMETKLVKLATAGKKGDALRFAKKGFDAYLTKPIKKATLFGCLLAVIKEPDSREDGEESQIITKYSLLEERHRHMTILLADDDMTNQMVGMAILKNRGFNVDVVANGQEVLDALLQKNYEMVLMDCQMPVMTGYEATEQISKWRCLSDGSIDSEAKEKIKISHIPIVAMTACAMPGDRKKCLEAGMDDYIAKPILPENLIELVDRWLDYQAEFAVTDKQLPDIDLPEEINWSDLLDRVMGKKDLACHLLTIFLTDFSARIQELREAVAKDDWPQIMFVVHSMKGIAGNVSAKGIYKRVLSLEQAAKKEDMKKVMLLLEKINCQFDLVQQTMAEKSPCEVKEDRIHGG